MFSREYICLVAGLQEYSLESDAKSLSISAILEELFDELSQSDAKLVEMLYGYYDCENLAAAKAGRRNFNPLGQLSSEQIDLILSGGESEERVPLSQEVLDVVAAYNSNDGEQGGDGVDTSLSFERALFAAYYKACCGSKNRFLREWSEADRNLRNVSAAITARVAGRAIADVVVSDGDVVDQLLRSSAVDFGLRGELPYLDAVISAVADEPNILEKEHRIDLVRWSIAEELSEMEYFSLDFILSYLVRVNIVARWQRLDLEQGRKMFAKLVESLSGKELVNKK